jgi:cyanophycin synthetase
MRPCAWVQLGDLVLIFADALTRSWKQVIKFKPEGQAAAAEPAAASRKPAPAAAESEEPAADGAAPARDDGALLAAGFVRDERGLRFVGDAGD